MAKLSEKSTGSTSRSRSRRASSSKTRRADVDFPNYSAATRWLYDHIDLERARPNRVDPKVFKLERMRSIMEALGNPEQSLRCVHVAGTNGKGSVTAMLSSALQHCGCAVGVYTSPHLVDLRERIQINGEMITHAHFTDALTQVAKVTEKLPAEYGSPTFFELVTATAFVYLAEQAVDIAIIETGLGGRLDSTNIITPLVSAITGIGLDHTQYLGDTVEAIAKEKAGIMKPGVPSLTIPQDDEIVEAMRAVATEIGSPFEVLGAEIEFSYRFEASPQLGPHTRVGLSTDRSVFEHVPVPLPGEHQAKNCGLVLAIVDRLTECGYALPAAKVIQGLEKTEAPGRMEVLATQPRVLLDGAHNPMAVRSLIRSIGAHVPYDSMVMIFGCAADKDVDEMLRQLALGGDKIIFTKARGNPRACEPADLASRFAEISPKMFQTADSLKDAISIASRAASRDDLICVTGSFYLVGEAKKLLADKGSRSGR